MRRGCIYNELALRDGQQDEEDENEEDEEDEEDGEDGGACIYDGLALKDEQQWPTRVAGSWPTRAPHIYFFFHQGSAHICFLFHFS